MKAYAYWIPAVGTWVKEKWTNTTVLVCAVDTAKKIVWLARPTATDTSNIFATDLDKIEPV